MLKVKVGDQQITIKSDCDWKIIRANCWKQDTRPEGWGQGQTEVIDGSCYPFGWGNISFDDDHWPKAVEMRAIGNADDEAIGRGSIRPFPVLARRGQPNLISEMRSPERVFWSGKVQEVLSDQLPEYAYDLEPIGTSSKVEECEPGWNLVSSAGEGAAISFVFDYHTGRPQIEIEAYGEEIIDIAVSERLPGEPSNEDAGPLGRVGPHAPANVMRYIARPGVQTIEKFDWSAIRGLQVVVYNASKGLKLRSVQSRLVQYPVEDIGSFECSDAVLNTIWIKGQNTARWCMHDAWEDCPSREKRQWITDACVAFEVSATAFGPSVYPLHKAFIEEVVLSQRLDGLFQMFVPGDHGQTGVVIPDYSLQFILSLGKYYQLSGDLKTVEKAMHAVERCLASFDAYLSKSGLLKDIPEWHFIEWANTGRKGEAGPINVLFAKALAIAAELAALTERKRLSSKWLNQSKQVVSGLESRHWNPKMGVYVDEVDPVYGTQGKRVSQHMNAMMVAFKFAPKNRWDAIVKKITNSSVARLTAAPPIVTGTGSFNPAKHIVATNTYFSRYLNDALDCVGKFDQAIAKMRSNYREMVDAETSTLWESYSDEASLCHVFSAGPVFQLIEKVVGVTPSRPGFDEVVVDVRTAGLTWAKATIPTPHGNVVVSWEVKDALLELEVGAPTKIKVNVKTPQGFRRQKRTKDKYYFYQIEENDQAEKFCD